jgi:predicted dehydrogenase
VTDNYDELIDDPDIQAVIIATPIASHYILAKRALMAGKHAFVEKPLTAVATEAQELISLADEMALVLMVGHVFIYNAAVQWVKRFIDSGELGRIFYVQSTRVNLGRIQQTTNPLWSFAPHDISILNYWFDSGPKQITTRGFSFLNKGVEDVIYMTLEYPGNIGAALHLGWLEPRKVRQMTVVGSRKMLIYDDVSLDSKIQVYDKGVQGLDEFLEAPHSYAEFSFDLRKGDVRIPHLNFSEPLRTECTHFIECIEKGGRPVTDGENGLSVVRVLEAAELSLRRNGAPIDIS